MTMRRLLGKTGRLQASFADLLEPSDSLDLLDGSQTRPRAQPPHLLDGAGTQPPYAPATPLPPPPATPHPDPPDPHAPTDPAPPLPPPPLAAREAALLPPHWLAELPLATTLTCVLTLPLTPGGQLHMKPSTLLKLEHSLITFTCTTSSDRYRALREAGELVLSGSELGALALAAENDRASRVWLADWLAAKQAEPSQRLDVATALGGLSALEARILAPHARWSLGRVALAWGFVVTDCVAHDEDGDRT